MEISQAMGDLLKWRKKIIHKLGANWFFILFLLNCDLICYGEIIIISKEDINFVGLIYPRMEATKMFREFFFF